METARHDELKMLFSVIIPAYNRLAFLPRTLASVWSQTFTDFEVIVVDDGSTDGTAVYLESLGGRIQSIRQPNLGPGAGRNAGAARARGEYLAFLDSDDLWFPWTLSTLAGLIRENSSPALLSAKVFEFTQEAELSRVREEPRECRLFTDYFASHREVHHVGAGTAVVRREEFDRSGGFTELPINGEDHDLALRLGVARGFVPVLKPVTLAWRRHPGSTSKDLSRSIAGSRYLVTQELGGTYPGGRARAQERREIITRHVRPVALECLRGGMRREAAELYRSILGWHLRLGRWKYLVAFPAMAAWAAVRRPRTN